MDPDITDPERAEANTALDMIVARLRAEDQERARAVIREARPGAYWFQPRYNTPADLLRLSPHNIYAIYRLFSGPAHGGMATKMLFTDEPGEEDIDPREHPRNALKAVTVSSRLLLEVSYVRDCWDNMGVGGGVYRQLLERLIAMRDF